MQLKEHIFYSLSTTSTSSTSNMSHVALTLPLILTLNLTLTLVLNFDRDSNPIPENSVEPYSDPDQDQYHELDHDTDVEPARDPDSDLALDFLLQLYLNYRTSRKNKGKLSDFDWFKNSHFF